MVLKRHRCRDKNNSCSKNGKKTKVLCFMCNDTSYLECFSINPQNLIGININNKSDIQFICHQCMIEKNGSSSRNSIAETSVENSSVETAHDISTSNVTNVLEMLEENLLKTISTNVTMKLDNIMNVAIKMNDILNKTATKDMIKETNYELIQSFERQSTEILQSIAAANEPAIFSSQALDWTMNNDSTNMNYTKSRHSLATKSLDDEVINIIKNSEKTTWDTLDILRKKIDDQSANLQTIKNDVNTLIEKSSDSVAKTTSRILISTNNRSKEAMTQTNEVIETKAIKYNNRLNNKKTKKRLSPNSSGDQPESGSKNTQSLMEPISPMTQHLQGKLHKLISNDTIIDLDSTDYAPNHEELMRVPNNQWIEVNRRKKRNGGKLIYTKHNTSKSMMKSDKKKISIFWSKLNPNFNIIEASNFIVNNRIAEDNDFAVTLTTKNINTSTYISYKLDLTKKSVDRAFECNEWPEGSYIRKYFKRKSTHAKLSEKRKNFF